MRARPAAEPSSPGNNSGENFELINPEASPSGRDIEMEKKSQRG